MFKPKLDKPTLWLPLSIVCGTLPLWERQVTIRNKHIVPRRTPGSACANVHSSHLASTKTHCLQCCQLSSQLSWHLTWKGPNGGCNFHHPKLAARSPHANDHDASGTMEITPGFTVIFTSKSPSVLQLSACGHSGLGTLPFPFFPGIRLFSENHPRGNSWFLIRIFSEMVDSNKNVRILFHIQPPKTTNNVPA